MTDNKQSNSESEGIFGYGKNISYHFQHWKRESELDGDLYASPVSIFEDYQSVQRVFPIQVRIIGPSFVCCNFIHLSFLDRIFGDSQSTQSMFSFQIRIIRPSFAGCSFVHSSFLDRIFGNLQSAQSAFAIQVQIIVSPSVSITKSPLFTNQDMKGFVLDVGKCLPSINQPVLKRF